jgi:hypothetical protein
VKGGSQRAKLAKLLDDQRGQKRLTLCSGLAPDQDCNPWEMCTAVYGE